MSKLVGYLYDGIISEVEVKQALDVVRNKGFKVNAIAANRKYEKVDPAINIISNQYLPKNHIIVLIDLITTEEIR